MGVVNKEHSSEIFVCGSPQNAFQESNGNSSEIFGGKIRILNLSNPLNVLLYLKIRILELSYYLNVVFFLYIYLYRRIFPPPPAIILKKKS